MLLIFYLDVSEYINRNGALAKIYAEFILNHSDYLTFRRIKD